MNERIKLLAEQAGPLQDVLSEIHGGTPGRYVKNKALLDFQLEKFAELIVRECALQCNHNDDMDRILEYFGVDSTSIKVGSRVKVVSGFNVGAKGTVSYIEPTGRMWVMRDGASTDVFYTPDEVVRIEQ